MVQRVGLLVVEAPGIFQGHSKSCHAILTVATYGCTYIKRTLIIVGVVAFKVNMHAQVKLPCPFIRYLESGASSDVMSFLAKPSKLTSHFHQSKLQGPLSSSTIHTTSFSPNSTSHELPRPSNITTYNSIHLHTHSHQDLQTSIPTLSTLTFALRYSKQDGDQ